MKAEGFGVFMNNPHYERQGFIGGFGANSMRMVKCTKLEQRAALNNGA